MKIEYEINVHGQAEPLTGEVELKHCPFCGETDELELGNTHTAVCWVECRCGVQVHGRHFANEKGKSTKTHFELAIESAKDHWNVRVKP